MWKPNFEQVKIALVCIFKTKQVNIFMSPILVLLNLIWTNFIKFWEKKEDFYFFYFFLARISVKIKPKGLKTLCCAPNKSTNKKKTATIRVLH
jgi:hypothetical protein